MRHDASLFEFKSSLCLLVEASKGISSVVCGLGGQPGVRDSHHSSCDG